MPDNHTPGCESQPVQSIGQPQLPPADAQLASTKTWTGKLFGGKATGLRKAPAEITGTVKVVEVCGDLGTAIQDHANRGDCLVEDGLSGKARTLESGE